MSVFNLDSNIGSTSTGSSSSKLGGLRIRNKAIPIINPLVKNPNWPSTIAPHKKGISPILYLPKEGVSIKIYFLWIFAQALIKNN